MIGIKMALQRDDINKYGEFRLITGNKNIHECHIEEVSPKMDLRENFHEFKEGIFDLTPFKNI